MREPFTPLSPYARTTFYLVTLFYMHVEHTAGLLSWGQLPRLWGPLHEPQLAHVEWCYIPQALLPPRGAQPLVDAALRLVLPRTDCPHSIYWLSHLNALALILAALAPLVPLSVHWLGRRLPAIVAASTMCLLDGMFEGVRDSNHRWLLPTVCFVALSLDDPGRPSSGARMSCLCAAACIFACAAWSKLTGCAGSFSLHWATGESLHWALARRKTWSGRMLLQRPWLFPPVLASSTLVLELAGFYVLLSPVRAISQLVIAPQCM